MKRILIINCRTLDAKFGEYSPWKYSAYDNVKMRDVHQANLVFLRTRTHFRCLKNRWAEQPPENELIPNFLFIDYLLRYKDYFTDKEIREALNHE